MFNNSEHTFAVCAYKESKYLEECINSLINQTVKSNIFIATSTPNEYIFSVAEKYGLSVFVNEGKKGIGNDWNFAYDKCETKLVTIAHQDDTYENTYTEEMTKALSNSKEPIIFFSGYGELRNGKKVTDNKLLKVKSKMLSPIKAFPKSKFIRRRVLSLGNAICCPAVTYVKSAVGNSPFTENFKSNIDWEQWEILSKKRGSFVYVDKPLMYHRIHGESTTSEIIGDNLRSVEDYQMYRKFWPKFIADILIKLYSGSQKSNEL